MHSLASRIYARHRSRYGLLVLGVFALALLLILGVSLGILVRIEDLSWEDVGVLSAVLGPLLAVLVGLLLRQLARDEDVVLRWVRDGPDPAIAADAWLAVSTAPGRVIRRALLVVLPAAVVITFVAFLAIIPANLAGVGFIGWGDAFASVYAGGFTYALMTIAVAPVLDEVTAYLPADFAPPTPESLSRKVLFQLVAAIVVAAVAAAGYSMRYGIGSAGALRYGFVAAAIALFFALPLAAIFTELAMTPVRALTAGTRRVAAGDLAAPVPLIARDEFGELIVSFNLMMVELQRATAELVDSRARIVVAADAERRRMERDLHDGAQQNLVLLRLKLGMLERAARETPESVGDIASDARDELNTAIASLRDLAHGIYPAVLESDGLREALEHAAARSAIEVSVNGDGTGRYPHDLEAAVYFCCLEALQNAAKYAGDGAHVKVALDECDGELHVSVTDDGAGFDSTTAAGGSGLQNMADRIGALHGVLLVHSRPGQGTTVTARVPLSAAPVPLKGAAAGT